MHAAIAALYGAIFVFVPPVAANRVIMVRWRNQTFTWPGRTGVGRHRQAIGSGLSLTLLFAQIDCTSTAVATIQAICNYGRNDKCVHFRCSPCARARTYTLFYTHARMPRCTSGGVRRYRRMRESPPLTGVRALLQEHGHTFQPLMRWLHWFRARPSRR